MSKLHDLPENAGVLICGHGSRAKIAEKEFSLLAKGLADRYPSLKVEYGFLEYSAPNIHMALDKLRQQGVENIYAVPGMLFAATHAQNDIPSVLTTYQAKHPGLSIEYGQELGLHDEMIAAFQARILEALGLEHVHDLLLHERVHTLDDLEALLRERVRHLAADDDDGGVGRRGRPRFGRGLRERAGGHRARWATARERMLLLPGARCAPCVWKWRRRARLPCRPRSRR